MVSGRKPNDVFEFLLFIIWDKNKATFAYSAPELWKERFQALLPKDCLEMQSLLDEYAYRRPDEAIYGLSDKELADSVIDFQNFLDVKFQQEML